MVPEKRTLIDEIQGEGEQKQSPPIPMVDVHTNTGVKVTAAVPSGASTGICEPLELTDGVSDYAVGNVNNIIGPALIGKIEIDAELDVEAQAVEEPPLLPQVVMDELDAIVAQSNDWIIGKESDMTFLDLLLLIITGKEKGLPFWSFLDTDVIGASNWLRQEARRRGGGQVGRDGAPLAPVEIAAIHAANIAYYRS